MTLPSAHQIRGAALKWMFLFIGHVAYPLTNENLESVGVGDGLEAGVAAGTGCVGEASADERLARRPVAVRRATGRTTAVRD